MAKQAQIGKGKIGFTTSNEFAAPIKKVWDALTQAAHINRYFVDKMTGDFARDLDPVVWHWKKWGTHTLQPTAFQKEKKLEFVWLDHRAKYLTTVTFTLKKKAKRIEVTIHERGWKQADVPFAFQNCEGWTTFLCYLKAHVEHGIDLRSN